MIYLYIKCIKNSYVGIEMNFSITEIVENVTFGMKPPFRPTLDMDSCDDEMIHVIKRCWAEDPCDRPDFQTLKSIIRKLNKYVAQIITILQFKHNNTDNLVTVLH